jgi:hypothetical protein
VRAMPRPPAAEATCPSTTNFLRKRFCAFAVCPERKMETPFICASLAGEVDEALATTPKTITLLRSIYRHKKGHTSNMINSVMYD